MSKEIVFRRWAARIRTEDEEAYADYVIETGIKGYRAISGNLGCQLLMRRLGDGSTEVATLSWWSSMEAINAFAGDDPSLARYYPEDDRFLLEKPVHVEHHRVICSMGMEFSEISGGSESFGGAGAD